MPPRRRACCGLGSASVGPSAPRRLRALARACAPPCQPPLRQRPPPPAPFPSPVLLNMVDASYLCFALDRDAAAVTRSDVHDVFSAPGAPWAKARAARPSRALPRAPCLARVAAFAADAGRVPGPQLPAARSVAPLTPLAPHPPSPSGPWRDHRAPRRCLCLRRRGARRAAAAGLLPRAHARVSAPCCCRGARALSVDKFHACPPGNLRAGCGRDAPQGCRCT